MLFQQSIYLVSIVSTCNTYFGNELVHVIYSVVSRQYSYTIQNNQEYFVKYFKL